MSEHPIPHRRRAPAPSARAVELLDRARQAVEEARRAHGELLEAVHHLEVEHVWVETGYARLTGLLTDQLHLDRGEARAAGRHAALLHPQVTPTGAQAPAALPATAAHLARGAIGDGHVRVIAETMTRLGRLPDLDAQTLTVAEEQLAGLARDRSPRALADAATEIVDALDPDGAAPTDDHHPVDELRMVQRRDGSLDGKFRYLDPATAEAVLTAIRHATPPPAAPSDGGADGAPGPRTLGDAAAHPDEPGETLEQRQARGLRDLVTDALTRGLDREDEDVQPDETADGDQPDDGDADDGADAGATGGDDDQLADGGSGPDDESRFPPEDDDGAAETVTRGDGDAVTRTRTRSRYRRSRKRAPSNRPRRAAACSRRRAKKSSGRTDRPTTEGGERVHVVVTLDWELLSGRLEQAARDDRPPDPGPTSFWSRKPRLPGLGRLGSGSAVGPETARRMACDAEIIPTVLGGRSEPLDVGRRTRVVTTAMRTALVVRDRHCAFPGCRRHARRCEAHHIRHWALGGPTELLNLTLLCSAHHAVVHHGGWTIRMVDGLPWFVPPRWHDLERRPRHNRPWRNDPAPAPTR